MSPTSLLVLFGLLLGACSASPVFNACFDCPPITKHGVENSFQEVHHGGLICFYLGTNAPCSYDALSGESWRDLPSACYPHAHAVQCDAGDDTSNSGSRPAPHVGSIMGVMKGKSGVRLTEQEREEKARILADLLAGGSYGA